MIKTIVYIGLGSNLGHKQENLAEARLLLEQVPGITIIKASSLYQTLPWGNVEQEDFINQVLEAESEINAFQLLERLQEIEIKLGRLRNGMWGPRTIDLDILLFGEERIREKNLIIPHPHMLERLFVLVPLAEISPELIFPNGTGIREVLARIAEGEKQEAVRKI